LRLAVGYLRAFDREPVLWGAIPAVDPHKGAGWTRFAGFDDIFFLAPMFFIRPGAAWRSLL
jgi:hypothetical protein